MFKSIWIPFDGSSASRSAKANQLIVSLEAALVCA